ncbi:MAG: Gfo/Idh/MocA family oxidoreductase [Bryobacteraceae bacterium]|nr:Gfo/Idh/MocA family oxidoreductase [Bryobacteraceae bacterium]
MTDSAADFLRVGLLGFGRCGAVHAQAWRDCPGVQLTCACDPDNVAQRCAEEMGIPAFTDVDEMLESAPLDAVCICTPPSSHSQLAARCLKRGLHVLCEKPLTTDLASAQHLWEVAADAGRKLVVSSKFRHVPELRVARELVRSGEIGVVKSFRIEFAAFVPMADRWNSRRPISGGGVIMDNGWHAFDLVHFLFGGIRAVRARLGDRPQGLEVEESASIDIVAAGGETGQAVLSWSLPPGGDEYVSIHGVRGSVHVGWKQSYLERRAAEALVFGNTYDKAGAHRRMMAAFREVIAGRQEPWISWEEILGITAAVEAAYRSHSSQSEETVGGPLRLAAVE